ncbi:MAG: protein translocase subunit SecF [Microthrixaceae bacterium]|nr:protein translocase subunit SecF [Microthrixaceae bacterium]MCB9386477.1 protein translocase subunit SecF [Microthrixaceae bacterium]MCO5320152.1 protein translocase subunit SecF [Microthrixaceae bacterium]
MSSTDTDTGGSDVPGPIGGKKMGLLKQLYRDSSDINFPRLFRFTGVASLLLVVASVVLLFTMGLKLSIDFEGGSVWEIPSQDFTAEQALEVLADKGIEGGEVQEATTVDGDRIVRVTGGAQSVQEGADAAVAFADAAGLESGEVTVNTVGPSWGDDISRQAGKSLIVFMALVAVYITWSMEARMAFAALVAVVHDIVITLGVFALFQLTITPATVISFLTILGFSLYDTIVVYDRVQENGDRLLRTGRYTYTAVMRRSLNQVAMRSVNTSITTVLPIISMLIVGKLIFGQQALADFSLALLIGLVLGTYSSMFVASPLTTALKEREGRWREVRSRMAAKGVDVSDTAWYGVGSESKPATPATIANSVADTGSPGGDKAAPRTGQPLTHRGHPPRPRKKKRR